ncbi:MAG: hypothetical protein HZB53_00115 [Chloroflexi bacterium]|nr:hypothetical protein [Chloroflexota bacterium]
MIDSLKWYLVLQGLGILGLPIAFRLFAPLPSRGYVFAKPLALLLAGYLFWIAGMFGFLANSTAGIVLAIVVVAGLSARLAWEDRAEIAAFIRGNLSLIAASEIVLAAFFVFGLVFRAYNPALNYTEKPMDLLFLNSVLRSPDFPPNDPWLSGYGISYYYFGYLLVSIVARLADVGAGVAFNVALASIIGMSAAGAFTITYDLIGLGERSRARPLARKAVFAIALLGALLVVVAGNYEGVVEFLNARGIGSSELYQMLGIKNLPPTHVSAAWFPDDNWWWWRASRVLATRDIEVIDEFPFFSFLIADLHPHVMALPYALMAVAAALAIFAEERAAATMRRWQSLLVPIVCGALGFLNSWDFPTYTGLVIAGFALNRARRSGWSSQTVSDTAGFGLFVGGLGLLMYLPFYLTFSSQASGIAVAGPLVPRTTFPQLILFWGFFLFCACAFILAHGRVVRDALLGRWGWRIFAGVLMLLLVFVALVQWWSAAAAILVLAAAIPLALSRATDATDADRNMPDSGAVFAALLLTLAFGLIFVVEFVYIRDSFGTRMNTVFKFYYQAWVLLALASAYAVYIIATRPAPVWRAAGLALSALAFAGTLVYPAAAFATQTNQLQRDDVTLDGAAYMVQYHRADAAAIEWLRVNAPPSAVVLEAVGGQYSEYGRVSSQTGIPTVLGWPGHELQWRGNGDEAARREPVVQRIYTSRNADEVRELLGAYGVTHIFVGELEHAKYGTAMPMTSMTSVAEKIYDRLGTAIYRVR